MCNLRHGHSEAVKPQKTVDHTKYLHFNPFVFCLVFAFCVWSQCVVWSLCRRKKRNTCSPWTTWSSETWRKASCPPSTSSPSSTQRAGQRFPEVLRAIFLLQENDFHSCRMTQSGDSPLALCNHKHAFLLACVLCVCACECCVWSAIGFISMGDHSRRLYVFTQERV